MKDASLKSVSKLLSLVLRHDPAKIGIELDRHGWADIGQLVQMANKKGIRIDRTTLGEVVESNDKQRFRISDDGLKIRANQGHSLQIDLELQPQKPPMELYHGTATRFLDSILETGLSKQQRQHVHLSADIETASKVGRRHGKLAILKLNIPAMKQNGCLFYLSENGVWLTDHVQPEFLKVVG